MRIISRKALHEFSDKHPDCEQALEAWYHDTKRADWKTPADIKNVYRNASILASNRVVFNIKGNQYRLVVAIQYQSDLNTVTKFATESLHFFQTTNV